MTDRDRLVVLPVGARALSKPPSGSLQKLSEATGLELLDLAKEEDFRGEVGESLVFRGVEGLTATRLLLVGCGDVSGAMEVQRAGVIAASRAGTIHATEISVARPTGLPKDGDEATFAQNFAAGIHHGAYQFDRYKSAEDDAYGGVESISWLFDDAEVEDALERARTTGDAVNFARDLVNEPAHAITPKNLAHRARKLAESLGLEATILAERDLRDRNFNLLWSVGKGSDNPPVLIHLVYQPDGEPRRKVALVGKGITFDTGGYSMKSPDQMKNMHVDMAGGAAVLGAAHALGRLSPKDEIHFIVPSAENSVSGGAMKPQDIVRGYGDKSVQILNTDAEGRLALADALAYAQEQDVDTIVDLATLTGSSVIALGEYTAALFASDESLADELLASADAAGEDLWRMPLTADIDRQLDTPFADMQNIGKSEGGAISAALFLKRWVDIDRWAHLDIAGPCLASGDDAFRPAGATGYGVATLVQWLRQ